MIDPRQLSIGDLVDYAPPECFDETFPLYWQMTRAERFCLLHLLRTLKPELALEIGTYKGGSLQALCRYSREVLSLDIDPAVVQQLQGRFANATLRAGDSASALPAMVDEINRSGKALGLVLIDGDHSEAGVRRDIEAVLAITPRRPVCVVMHDSFHPPCRMGMRAAAWAQCRHVHYVELDFVTGIFLPGRPSVDHSMYGGFALALLLPEARDLPLEIFESQRDKFEIVRQFAAQSGLVAAPRPEPALRALYRRLRSRARVLLGIPPRRTGA